MRLWRLLHVFVLWTLVMTVQADVPSQEAAERGTGEAARYEATYVGDWPVDEGTPLEGLSYHVAQPEDMIRADGLVAPAWPVHVLEHRLSMMPTGHLQAKQVMETRWVDDGPFAIQNHVIQYTSERHCIIDALEIIAAPGPCSLPGAAATVDAEPVQELGLVRIDGRLLQQHVMGPIQWWTAPDSPAPVRVEHTGAHGTVRFDLVGLQTGQGQPVDSAIAAPVVQRAEPTPWLVVADVPHPFPISEAFNGALHDRDWPHLRDWLREHPEAVAIQASYDGGWTIHVADDREVFAFQVAHEATNFLLGTGLALQQVPPTVPPTAAPGQVVTLSSLERLWLRHGGDALVNYGFSIADGQLRLAASHDPISWSKDGRRAIGTDLLVVDEKGQAMERTGRSSPMVLDVQGVTIEGWAEPPASNWWAWLGALSILYVALPKGVLGLFSRLAPHQLTKDPTRSEIMEALRAEPGLHLRALADRIDAPVGRVRHHVRKLVQGGLVRERMTPGYTCFFVDEGTPRTVVEAGPLARSAGARRVLQSLEGSPCARDVAVRAGLSPATASYHLKRLRDAGLVDAQRAGRSVHFCLTRDGDEARRCLGL